MSVYELTEAVRRALNEATYSNRDPVIAAVQAFVDYRDQFSPNGRNILNRITSVEIHRGTENFYRISFVDMSTRDEIDLRPGILLELTQKDLSEGPKAFNEKYLQHFDELPIWEKGEWPSFVRALLHHKNVINHEIHEDTDDERLAVEAFIERAQRWRPTRDLAAASRDDSKVWWDDKTGSVFVRSERIDQFLKTTGRKITIQRFAHLLRQDAIVIKNSVQLRVPAADGTKTQNVRFWRLNAAALHMTESDILAPISLADDLPPTDADAPEGGP